MPSQVVSATKYTRAVGPLSTSFSTARESDSSSHIDNTTSTNLEVVQYFQDSGKGATNHRFYRFFCAFDLSSFSGHTITNLLFNYRSTTSTSVTGAVEKRVAILKFDGMGSGPSFSNYTDSEFFDDIDYSTPYTAVSSGIPEWVDANTSNTITLNSTAQSHASSNGELKIAVVQFTNDYNNTNASGNVHYRYYENFSTGASGFVPFLSFTNTPPGYPHDIVDVSTANIGEVVDVATANIDKVVGIGEITPP